MFGGQLGIGDWRCLCDAHALCPFSLGRQRHLLSLWMAALERSRGAGRTDAQTTCFRQFVWKPAAAQPERGETLGERGERGESDRNRQEVLEPAGHRLMVDFHHVFFFFPPHRPISNGSDHHGQQWVDNRYPECEGVYFFAVFLRILQVSPSLHKTRGNTANRHDSTM